MKQLMIAIALTSAVAVAAPATAAPVSFDLPHLTFPDTSDDGVNKGCATPGTLTVDLCPGASR